MRPGVATQIFFSPFCVTYCSRHLWCCLWFQLQLLWTVPPVDTSFACWHCLTSSMSLFACSGLSLSVLCSCTEQARNGEALMSRGHCLPRGTGLVRLTSFRGTTQVAFDLFLRGFPVESAPVAPAVTSSIMDPLLIVFPPFLSPSPHSFMPPVWDRLPDK